MPNFPQIYPWMEWWIGKSFVQQAVILANSFLANYSQRYAGFVLAEYRLYLNRALRALHGSPIAGQDLKPLEDWIPVQLMKQLEFSIDLQVSSKTEFIDLTKNVLTQVKEIFWEEYFKVRREEFDYFEEAEIADFLDEEEYNEADFDQYYEPIKQRTNEDMRYLHDQVFWIHTEAGVIAGFGGYGEWREFEKIVEVQMEIDPAAPFIGMS